MSQPLRSLQTTGLVLGNLAQAVGRRTFLRNGRVYSRPRWKHLPLIYATRPATFSGRYSNKGPRFHFLFLGARLGALMQMINWSYGFFMMQF